MLSDSLDKYDNERIKIIRKTLPPIPTMTAETGTVNFNSPAYTWTKLHGFFVVNRENPTDTEEISPEDALNMAGNYATMNDNHPFSSLWAFHFNKETETWCVAVRIATVPLKKSKIQIKNLSLDPRRKYLAFDFWKQKFLGITEGALDVEELKLGCCQVIGFRAVKDRPQFIASSRHVSMDLISVVSQSWANNRLELTLYGVADTSEIYWFYMPEEFIFKSFSCEGGQITADLENGIIKITISFIMENVRMRLNFSNKKATSVSLESERKKKC